MALSNHVTQSFKSSLAAVQRKWEGSQRSVMTKWKARVVVRGKGEMDTMERNGRVQDTFWRWVEKDLVKDVEGGGGRKTKVPEMTPRFPV